MMEETLAVALEILEEGRDKVGGLRGATGQRDDLVDILRSYGERLAKQHGNAFAMTLAGAPRALPAAVHDELQAIAREALNNAFHHAQARHVEVRIAFEERELEVTVADDGAGIPSGSAAGRAGHWGIPGMRERAAQLGAQLGVSTAAGQGTSWRLVVPARIAYGTAGQDKAVVGEPG
jgi:signal transduction histidine kinase